MEYERKLDGVEHGPPEGFSPWPRRAAVKKTDRVAGVTVPLSDPVHSQFLWEKRGQTLIASSKMSRSRPGGGIARSLTSSAGLGWDPH
mmetsp:Transcript_11183/g.21347  ORF Transcript_11183/g.21347 Transcript_11183/m.21347 type:complete len:88 (+) Transcript_11183:598-861(+)